MLIKCIQGLLAAAAFAALGGCSTPCDAPGRLCAPTQANTSALSPPPARAAATAAALPEPEPEPVLVQTMAVEDPAIEPFRPGPAPRQGIRAPIRIGLMLPLRSDGLGAPAAALRAGFMAAYERDRDGFVVNLIETGDSAQEALAAYASALPHNDIVVGPLARPSVAALAASSLVSKPTIALNYPEVRSGAPEPALPPQMLVIGLSIEDEARQVANWASGDHPQASALIVTGTNAWQRRIAGAFAARWKQLGHAVQVAEIGDSNGYLSEAALNRLRARTESEPPALVFAALDAGQAGQVRAVLGTDAPFYGTSSVNPGTEPGAALEQLDGMLLLDLPWEVQPDHPAVMVYPRLGAGEHTLDMDRLYALGIDAFRVAREIALHPGAGFGMDGVTGRLQVSFGAGPARFERTQSGAMYQGGGFTLIRGGH